MKELKIGDVVEVKHSFNRWISRIFVKYGKDNGIIVVHYQYEIEYKTGMIFYTEFCEDESWRHKQEPKYIPFTFEDRELLKGRWIKDKYKSKLIKQILLIVENRIHTVLGIISYELLLDNYIFVDGTPCGKKIKEK